MKACLTILGILVVIVAMAAGAAFYLLGRTPESVSQLPEVKVSKDASASFDQKIAQVGQAVSTAQKTSKPVPVTLRVTEQELTSKVAEIGTLQSGELQARDVQIRLVPGKIVTTAKVSFMGLDVPVTLTATVSVRDGKPHVVVQNVQFGGLPLPDTLKNQLVDTIQWQMDEAWEDLPVQVQEVRIEQGVAIITGLAKPK